MGWNEQILNTTYDRCSGKCHICHATICFSNYGEHGRRGAWEIDHHIPQSRGGSDWPGNLFPACTSCNRSKQARSTKSQRSRHGKRRAPLSREMRPWAQLANALQGARVGGQIGECLNPELKPLGMLFGCLIGLDRDPDR
ncbi:MAG: HNH endonuclease [Phycisphaeraceae bacterium]|nr:HNH endonuclease [Phycisphaeraceae bacterium]MBX3367706.1 HNH endonuclease [Phycisphaeraceae bacterium]